MIHVIRTPRRACKATFIILLSLVLTFIGAGAAHATTQEYAVHIGPAGWAPFAMIERQGSDVTYYGIMFDILDDFEAEHPGYKRTLVLLTRKRANARMAKGDAIDVMLNSPLFVSPDIKEHYRFTETLFSTEDKVVTRKDQDFIYQKPMDLQGKVVGTIRGYSYGQLDSLIKNGLLEDIRVDHHTQAIGMLSRKRIDAYLGNIHVTPLYIKQMGLNIDDFKFSEASLYKFDIAFAVNRNKPGFYRVFNDFLRRYLADGSLDKLIRSYIE